MLDEDRSRYRWVRLEHLWRYVVPRSVYSSELHGRDTVTGARTGTHLHHRAVRTPRVTQLIGGGCLSYVWQIHLPQSRRAPTSASHTSHSRKRKVAGLVGGGTDARAVSLGLEDSML